MSETKAMKYKRSMFGVQHDSKKSTAPIYGFGSADRTQLQKVFLTPEHSKSDYGKNSPGPIYDVKSSVGQQTSSKNTSAPLFSFGTADRFSRKAKMGQGAQPGPGAYRVPSSLGTQHDSSKNSAPDFGFGSSTRVHQEKVYLSEEQAKVNYGHGSPGPSAYKSLSSVGKQASSKNESMPSWAFSSEERFKYDYVERASKIPGAGQYNSTSSVGQQPNSKKKTLPKFSFGTCTRNRRHKVYISPEHEKQHFGECSPGPASIGPMTALGRQQNSTMSNASVWTFGSAKRFVYNESRTPGPGTYD